MATRKRLIKIVLAYGHLAQIEADGLEIPGFHLQHAKAALADCLTEEQKADGEMMARAVKMTALAMRGVEKP